LNEPHTFDVSLAWPADPAQKRPPDPAFSRNATLSAPGHAPFAASSPTIFSGDATRYNPEELLALALSHCHMLTYLAIAAKRRVEVLAYADRATATLAPGPSGKLQVTDVVLRPVVTLARGADLEAARAMHARAHENCFIANSVNFTVRNEPSFAEAGA